MVSRSDAYAVGMMCAVCVTGCAEPVRRTPGSAASPSADAKTFTFSVFDEQNIRRNPTTQVAIRVAEWPGQTFLLWLPEAVGDLWVQWEGDVAHQDFTRTPAGGLRWAFDRNPKAHITAELIPRAVSLLLEVRVRNRADEVLENVRAQNCFHLSSAPDFACEDFTRIYLRSDGQWRTLDSLRPTVGLPMFYRPGFLASGHPDSWDGHFRNYVQETRADHPLMMCTSRNGCRTVGTASDDYECVFHNQAMPYLLCIHSQQAPVPQLQLGDTATFRQVIYFIDGGITDCIRAFERDTALLSPE